jgi:hypothetical protein
MADLAAAVAVAKKLGLPESVTWERIPLIRGVDARTQIVEGRFTILNDSYNANPDSMRAALGLLCKAKNRRRVAVLGDMFELGAASAELHRGLGDWIAAQAPPELLLLAGSGMAACHEGLLAPDFRQRLSTGFRILRRWSARWRSLCRKAILCWSKARGVCTLKSWWMRSRQRPDKGGFVACFLNLSCRSPNTSVC